MVMDIAPKARQAAEKPSVARAKRADGQQRTRLAPSAREGMIVAEAVRFFAEHGFGGETRELARRIGITQPLLYRYFPTKQALIDRVFDSVFVERWNPEWEDLLRDRTLDFECRLTRFLQAYATVMLSHDWVRLFLFAGLAGLDASTEFMKRMRDRVFGPIIGELREINGRPPLSSEPPNLTEHELVWGLIASLFYVGVRHWVYHLGVPEDVDALVVDKVRAFLHGTPAAIAARDTALATQNQLPNLYSRQPRTAA
jgi:AcrR family transcriptional regulator